MKLELFSKPEIRQVTIGRNFNSEVVAKYDASKRSIGDTITAISGQFICLAHHVHFAFYFQVPPDYLIEILAYTRLRVTRTALKDEDEGILSGTLHDFVEAIGIFCTKKIDKDLRLFFNRVGVYLEMEDIKLPYSKIDLGDQTYAVK